MLHFSIYVLFLGDFALLITGGWAGKRLVALATKPNEPPRFRVDVGWQFGVGGRPLERGEVRGSLRADACPVVL